jgi:hypothetical protein
MFEVADGGSFAEKFGIGNNAKIGFWIDLANDALYLIASPDRNRGFRNYDSEAGKLRGHLASSGVDVRQVRVAVAAAGRRSNSNEDGFGIPDHPHISTTAALPACLC